jgi:hypothetical protein
MIAIGPRVVGMASLTEPVSPPNRAVAGFAAGRSPGEAEAPGLSRAERRAMR